MNAVPTPPLTARQALYAIVLIMLLDGIISGNFLARRGSEAYASAYFFSIALHFMCFLWYCRDRDARGLKQSRWFSMFMVGMMMLAMPWYVLRSRPWGQKTVAFFALLGFALLCLVIAGLGGVIGALLPSGT